MKLEISHIITLFTMAAVLGGFYYTTQHRLDSLEGDITTLSKQVKQVRKLVNKKRVK